VLQERDLVIQSRSLEVTSFQVENIRIASQAGMPHPSWNDSYASGEPLPWDTGTPDPMLIATIESHAIQPGRTLEVGCGTGTSAIYLAEHGFDVVGVDVASSDTPGPFSFDRGPPFELEAEPTKEINVASRSSTTIPTLSIRSSAVRPIYKAVFNQTTDRGVISGRAPPAFTGTKRSFASLPQMVMKLRTGFDHLRRSPSRRRVSISADRAAGCCRRLG
jgi:hypothetical protein